MCILCFVSVCHDVFIYHICSRVLRVHMFLCVNMWYMYQLCGKINSNQHGKMNIFTCSHAHSAAVSTFKWHFCPDKYWKWTRPPLSTFLRLHPFTAYMWAHLHSDQFSVAMSKSYFQYLLCWGVAREWGGSISKSTIGKYIRVLSIEMPSTDRNMNRLGALQSWKGRVWRMGGEPLQIDSRSFPAKTDQKGWNAFNKGEICA